MDKIRGLVRPIITLSGWGVLLYFAFDDLDIRKVLAAAVIGYTGYWFGERAQKTKGA